MLERLQIEGFRALAHINVPLKPLTVLIGQNDSGKSSFLAAIRLLASNQSNSAPDRYDFRDADHKVRIAIAADLGGRPHLQQVNGRYMTDMSGVADLTPHELYVLPSSGVPMESQGFAGQLPPMLGGSGERTAAILDTFLRSDRKRFDQIESVVREHIPGIEALSIETPDIASRRVDLVLRSGMKMPADRASTGARLMIFFITLAYHPTPPKLILLEEPENGVHPKRLQQIVNLLREITEGKHGKHAAQIIMTTHSPYLLDSIDPKTDQVLVFRRNEAGERTAEPVDTERLKGFLAEFMLGEVWFNQEEVGLVKRIG